MRRKACIVWVDFHPLLLENLTRYSMQNSAGKRRILQFLEELVARGYQHFILFIERPSDVWIAELLCYFTISQRETDVRYSIGVWKYDNNPCDWIELLPFDWEIILKNAYRVFLRSDCWYDKSYRVERIYIQIRENWIRTNP